MAAHAHITPAVATRSRGREEECRGTSAPASRRAALAAGAVILIASPIPGCVAPLEPATVSAPLGTIVPGHGAETFKDVESVAGAPGADAGLLVLAERLELNRRTIDGLCEPFLDQLQGIPAEIGDQLAALTIEYRELMAAIGGTPARTSAGLRAKARAAMLHMAPGGDEDAPSPDDDAFVAWSLCRDLVQAPPGRDWAVR